MNKRLLIIGGAAIAIAGVFWLATRGGADANADPAIAALIKQEKAGDDAALGEAVKSPDVKVAQQALIGLRNVGGPKVVRRMVPALTDSRKSIRHSGLVNIGMLGSSAAETVPTVSDLTKKDPEPEVRAAAATALGKLLGAYAGVPLTLAQIEPIVAALDDADSLVRASAVNSLQFLLRVKYQQFKPEGLPGERQKAVREIRSVLAQNVEAWNEWQVRLASEGKASK